MKKIICVILSAVFISSVFAGCSNNEQQADDYSTRIVVDTHYSETDESAYRAYEKLCQAVMNYESDVKFNTQLIDDATQLFYTAFPLNSLAENISVSSDNTGLEITYRFGEDEHNKLVADFYARVDEILTACNIKNSSRDRCVFNIYTYIAENFQIDSSVVSVYDVLMQGRGTVATINSVFEYLVLTAGGSASHVINVDSGFFVSLVIFNSNGYFFDVGNEINDNSGKALKYFAMNSERLGRYARGSFTFTDGDEVDIIEDDTYSALADSVSYNVNENDISVDCGGNKTFELQIV